MAEKRPAPPFFFEKSHSGIYPQPQVDAGFSLFLCFLNQGAKEQVGGSGHTILWRTEIKHVKGVAFSAEFSGIEGHQPAGPIPGIEDPGGWDRRDIFRNISKDGTG